MKYPDRNRLAETAKKTLIGLLTIVLLVSAAITISLIVRSAAIPGPNTVGEAGKVWYAQRISEGKDIFLPADQPPFYPPMHGLLHYAVVASIGDGLDLEPLHLYFVGRTISLICTIGAVFLAVLILKKLKVGWRWRVLAILILSSYYPILQHTASYRPDNWLLFLSISACYLLISESNRLAFPVVIVLPALAFAIKATGLTIAVATVAYLAMRRQWRQMGVYAILSAVILFSMLMCIHWFSEGQYGLAFSSGLEVDYSVKYALMAVLQPIVIFVTVAPLLSIGHVWPIPPIPSKHQKAFLAVFVFCIVELICNFCFSMRGGSNTYYFISAYFFGTILLVNWLSLIASPQSEAHRGSLILGLILLLLQLSHVANHARVPSGEDVAALKTKMYADDRSTTARFINGKQWTCLSDDAGLNVLLERPLLIYPLRYQLMMESRVKKNPMIMGMIAEKKADIVVLTELRWSYHGKMNMPQSLLSQIDRHYVKKKLIENVKYTIFVPRVDSGEE